MPQSGETTDCPENRANEKGSSLQETAIRGVLALALIGFGVCIGHSLISFAGMVDSRGFAMFSYVPGWHPALLTSVLTGGVLAGCAASGAVILYKHYKDATKTRKSAIIFILSAVVFCLVLVALVAAFVHSLSKKTSETAAVTANESCGADICCASDPKGTCRSEDERAEFYGIPESEDQKVLRYREFSEIAAADHRRILEWYY